MTATSAAGNDAYRRGYCIDCLTQRYSPGRPRCQECHDKWLVNMGQTPEGLIAVDDVYSHDLCANDCGERGIKFRARHDTGLCEFCTGIARRAAVYAEAKTA